MTPKRVVPRERALRDIEEAIGYYEREADTPVALGFVDALERACAHVGRHPGTGSPRYAHALDLPGLRSWPPARYPYIVFYMERADHIDVWRVLHERRDIPAWLQGAEDREKA